jgi:hypothetical protein
VCCGVTFPSKEILQLAVASDSSGSEYLFYFIFWLVINKFWGWFGVVRAMFWCFVVLG